MANLTPELPYSVTRGKILGGSTTLNGTYYVRARKEDFGSWVARGNPEWSYEKVLPFYKKAEKDLFYGETAVHGGSGPVPIARTQPEDYQPLARAFAAAFAELGFRAEPDKNGEQPPGYGPVPRNAVDGVRINTGIAYINPHRQRPNLTIRGNTLARKVVFDGTRATGLEVETDGQAETIGAGQIVLAAGAFNSPHLLLLSGIGPAAELTAAGVPVIEDLPGVGKDFSDHPDIFVTVHRSGESIRRWWKARGSLAYPDASRLLITADAGGSNGYRYRVWKSELAALSAETGLAITVCHFPPGTSKWNKIEHRLFSHITMNWRGRPLTSHEVVVQTIAATHNRGGLHVEAALDTGDYPIGVAISKKRMAALPLERHATHGTWNYTLCPWQASSSEAAAAGEAGGPAWRRQAMLHRLADSRLTGMTAAQLQQLAGQLAPSQAARAQQRYSQQRGGRARRATGNPRGKPLFDDAARLLLTLLYQRQVCSMNVLADLLEVTATCIGNLVRETREVLEDHGHQAGVAPVRFATPDALLAFLGSDLRPARTEIIDRLSHPALTGLTRGALHSLTERLAAGQGPKPNASATKGAAACASPEPGAASSPRKSATANASCSPSSTRGDCAPSTSSPAPSATSADPRSATSSAKLSHSSSRKATFRTTHRAATAHQPISSLQHQPATTRRQVDSLRLQCARQRCQDAPGSTAAIASRSP